MNANFASYKVDKKISGGACYFLGHFLASWHGKKKNLVKLSTVEAEYIVVVLYCTQKFLMKQTLSDFSLSFAPIPIKCDSKSVISIFKSLVQHSRIENIKIRNHFIRDYAHNGGITLEFVGTKDQLIDIFIKPLSEDHFIEIRRELRVINLN